MKNKILKLKRKVSDIDKITNCMLILSPLIDILISYLIRNFTNISIIGTVIRGLILFGFLIYVFLFQKKKNQKIYITIILICLYSLLFLINRALVSSYYLKEEIVTLLKFLYFPLLLACLLLTNNGQNKKRMFYECAILYGLFLLLPMITNTAVNTYSASKKGIIGWFNSPNEISSIISILLPFVAIKFLTEDKKGKKIKYFIITIVYIFAMLSIGTKTPIIAVAITTMCLLLSCIFRIKENKKRSLINIAALVLILVFTIGNFIFGFSFSNITKQYTYFETIEKTTEMEKEESKENPENSNVINIDNQNPIMINEFQGTSNKDYRSSSLINAIFSSRDIYAYNRIKTLKNYSYIDYFFGLGKYQIMNGRIMDKLVEIDFLDVLFIYGIIGFILYFILPVYIISKLIIYFLKHFKNIIKDDENYALYISTFIALLISVFAGHVLSAPAVSTILTIIISTLYLSVYKIKNDEKALITKKMIIITAVTFIIFLGIILINKKGDPIVTLKLENNKFSCEECQTKLIDKKTISSDYAEDKINIYTVEKNNVDILKYIKVERNYENIKYTYFTIKNDSLKDSKVTIKIVTPNNSEIIHNFKEDLIDEKDSDKLSLPALYINANDSYNLIYKPYAYTINYRNYDNINYTYYKSLISEYNFEDNLNSNIKLRCNAMLDFTIVSSSKPLFNSEDEIKKMIDNTNNNNISTWQTFDGIYTKLPYSIEPVSKEEYGRNLLTYNKTAILDIYKETKNKFFETYILNQLHSLYTYHPRYETGVWLTEYTPIYMKKTYGLRALYFDTEHNDAISKYFYKLSSIYNNNAFLEEAELYAKFITSQYKNNKSIELSYGKLFPDYISNRAVPKQISLQHQLVIINNLLNMSIKTGNQEYKNIALEFLKTVTNIGDAWIKDNGDLWYKINSNEEFSEEDYKTLTLENLVDTQELLIKINGKKDDKLDNLINSKIKYLSKINFSLDSYTYNKLKEVGYIE